MHENSSDQLTVKELQQLLYQKKRAQRHQRLQRLKESGRVVVVDGLSPPNPDPPPLPHLEVAPTGAMQQFALHLDADEEQLTTDEETDDITETKRPSIQWRWVANKLLLFIEVAAVFGLVAVLLSLWDTRQELNQELAQTQREESQSLALPTPTATPVIDVVVLPSGHKPPVNGRPPEPGEAGDIPAHLRPAINAYVPPPVPTPSIQQARRIQIPAIDVDSPIFQGDDWEHLKKGVGQHIGSVLPGEDGNLVLSAHNDIYGEIFRYLDKLTSGDEIIVDTDQRSYTYVVRKIQQVDPTDVWVMAPTDHASSTLISCYPYQVNNKRLIVFADLVTSVK